MENDTNTEVDAPLEALDHEWYKKLTAIHCQKSFHLYKLSAEENEQQKKAFLEGTLKKPILHYTTIDTAALEEKERQLLELKQEILEKESREVIKKSYHWKINEMIAELRLLKATKQIEKTEGSTKEHNKALRRFQKYSNFIYGKPDKDIFWLGIDTLRQEAEEAAASKNPKIQEAAQEVLAKLPQPQTHEKPPQPEQNLVKRFQATTREQIGHLVELPPKESPHETFTAEEAWTICNNIIQKTLQAEGWTVEIVDNQSIMSVDAAEKKLRIPQGRNYEASKLKELIAHEIGTHAMRHVQGERSRLKLLGIGLDRYDRGDEGIAKASEGAMGESGYTPPLFQRNVQIGLAMGLDNNGAGHNFRELFDIMEPYYFLQALKKGGEEHDARASAQKDTWNACMRTFRGSDASTPGYAYTKDIIYAEGQIGLWKALGENPDEMKYLRVGQYNPDNPRHLWILQQSGIRDQDLEILEAQN